MILNRLTLFNFGIYRGLKEFNLRPDPKRPILIIGGKNGAGKTTLLEAIRLCLYGPLALEQRRPTKAAYEDYLRQRIHHPLNQAMPINRASVALEFDYALAGETRTYSVTREWNTAQKRFQEELLVQENGQALADMEANKWQDFLRDLIPPGLSQLFFFDGEKIQAIAEDGPHNLALAQAVKALLGLNIVEQLQTDLTIYRQRQQKRGSLTSAEQDLNRLQAELKEINSKKQTLLADQSDLQHDYDLLDQNIELQEAEIKRLGGEFARQRDEHKVAKIQLKTEIEQLEQNIRELCEALLPFALIPAQTAALEAQLLREAEYQRWQVSKQFIEQKLDLIQAKISSDDFWQGTGAEVFIEVQQAVGQRVVETLQALLEAPAEVQQTRLRHQISEPEQRQLLQWIAASQIMVPAQLSSHTHKLSALKERQQTVDEALHRVPDDDVLAPLMETLNSYQQNLGGLKTQQDQLTAQLRRLEAQEQDVWRQQAKAEAQKKQYQGLSRKIQQVVDVELVLTDFKAQLMALRVRQLETAFVSNFNRLCRKRNLLDRVKIDATNFVVTLIGQAQREFPKSSLSAGEKQIYAIAMLWALRQVSGRPLPIIIDTPLGRLDSDHRHNLIERYFPHAGHQVILFSTDTEVDAQFFAAMQPHITRAYHLDHNQSQKATEVNEGYFWSTNGNASQ